MRPSTILLPFSLHLLPISSLALTNPPTANLITLSTTTNLTLTAPVPLCVQITHPPMLGLNPTNCEIAVPIICRKFTTPPQQLRRDVWIWTELPGCSLGYYLPAEASVPYQQQCESTFGAVVEGCATDSRFNAGVVNVLVLPGFAGPGEAVVQGKLRYAMAPERLTLPFGKE